MAIWYEIARNRQRELLDALAASGVETNPIAFDGRLIGCECRMKGVKTTLEFHHAPDPENLEVVRHEGIHLLHPIRFHRLQQAIIKSLNEVEARVDV